MRNILLVTALLAFTFTGLRAEPAARQRLSDPAYKGGILVDSVRMEAKGDFVYVNMDFTLENVSMRSAGGVNLIPTLTAPGHTVLLPQISIKGLNEYLDHERKMSLLTKSEHEAYAHPYKVVKANRASNEIIEYRHMLPYEPWMADAAVEVQADNCGCGITALMTVVPVGRIGIELPPYEIVPHLAYVVPETVEKHREAEVEAFLDFEVNKTDIRPRYMNNPQELDKIHKMIDELNANPHAIVNRLDIIGYASPEGTLATNKRLSEGRAMSLRNYLQQHYPFPRDMYAITFGGENWEGLVKALASTQMEYKDEVLDIINSVSVEDGRETEIMRLGGGAPYRYMLQNIFPHLRVAVCRIDYSIKGFTPEESREIIKTRPQDLSLSEMFLLANAYEQGSDDFIELFETAVRMFPTDEAANLNAAASALANNNTSAAKRYLTRVTPESYPEEYNNAMGVLAMLEGDYDKAEKYFNATALEAAKQNLEELKMKKVQD